jgi:hypothetical protein
MQFVWVVLSNATGTIDARSKERDAAELEWNSLQYRNANLNKEIASLNQQIEKLEADPESSAEAIAQINERKVALEKNLLDNTKTMQQNDIKFKQAQDQIISSTKILVGWLPMQGWLQTTRPPEPGWFDSEKEEIAKLKKIEQWEEQQKSESSFRNIALQTWAKQIQHGMSAYFLPLIYGLVGACAFVLRAMSRQMRELTFSTTESTLQFTLRLVLGGLAGIAVGWFLKPDPSSADIISSISPLALAFIAGYSVELVFTAMDKIINAFTGRAPGEPKETNTTSAKPVT